MRLDDYNPGDDIRDLGRGGGGMSFGGGGGGGGLGILFSLLPMLFGRRLGCGGIALIVVLGLAFLAFSGGGGGMMSSGVSGGAGAGGQSASAGGNVACDTSAERLACNVFGNTHQVWAAIFQQEGQQYRRPTLNFFTDQNQSGCGAAQSAMGPFYCPADQGVYLDTAFFDELATRFGAAGDAAQAYVIAHEVGHHIQVLTGVSNQVNRQQSRASEAQSNALQVRMELQADCYAGVWAARARNSRGESVIEPGDIEEAMRAAQSVGDDTLQQAAGQRPVPESFTHGSSAQRMRWLQRGLQTGDANQCDTFATDQL